MMKRDRNSRFGSSARCRAAALARGAPARTAVERVVIAGLLSLATAVAGLAQGARPAGTPVDASVAAVEEHLAQGDYAGARAALEAWRQNASGSPASERRRAALLEARLERDGTAAQHAYLAAALSQPFAPEAATALLRVGQAALLQGDTTTARTHLRRFIDDFPASERRAEGFLWLARTAAARGNRAIACEHARGGIAAGPSPDVLPLLRRQEQRSCGEAAHGAWNVDPSASSGAAPRTDTAQEAEPRTDARRFSVQAGAFRAADGARALADRLRAAGFDARIATVPGSRLHRVRTGGFQSSADAARLRDRLRASGFEAVVVSDAQDESAATP